jgi:hypothetical protein
MRGRVLLQPGGFGGLDLGLGLCGTGFGGGFLGKRLTALELGRLQLGLLTKLFGLPMAAATPGCADRYDQGGDQQNCYYDGDHNPYGVGAHAHTGPRIRHK